MLYDSRVPQGPCVQVVRRKSPGRTRGGITTCGEAERGKLGIENTVTKRVPNRPRGGHSHAMAQDDNQAVDDRGRSDSPYDDRSGLYRRGTRSR
jgi:hypothetical protein